MTRSGRQCECRCCDVCVEKDDMPFQITEIHAKVKFKDFTTALGWTASPLTIPGGGSPPSGWPSSISTASDLDDLELTLGQFLCGRSVFVAYIDCLFKTLLDSLSGGDGLNLGMFYNGTGGGTDQWPDQEVPYGPLYPECIAFIPPFGYTQGGVAFEASPNFIRIQGVVALVRTLDGARYMVAYVNKGDGTPNFTAYPPGCTGTALDPCRPKWMYVNRVGIVQLSESGRVACDGLEVEIPLTDVMASQLDNPRFPPVVMDCQSFEIVTLGRPIQEAVSGPASILVTLYTV